MLFSNLLSSQVSITPWRMNKGGGIIYYSIGYHGNPIAYNKANIPNTNASGWTTAPTNSNGEIHYSVRSILSRCLSQLDFTYFETFIGIPNGYVINDLNVKFSDYVLIKSVNNINLQSEASIVSIDKLNNSINAKGNFKMLSVDLTPSVTKASITVEDSKQVWIKLPQTPYNLMYNGIDTKMIHPKKFNLKTSSKQHKKQYFKYSPLKSNEKTFKINAFSSTIQIYDIAWKDLKVKNLSKL